MTEERTSPDPLSGAHRFQLLVDAVKDYAIYLLDPEGYVTSWNTGAQRFKGYAADEILGQHFSRFYTEEDRAAGLPRRALHIAATEGKFEDEGWRVRKDGTRFWTSVLIDPVLDTDGKLIGFAKVTRDITERRRAEEEIEKAREALNQAQKMEAVGRLTGGVAHDFNNLLTIIRSSIDLLQRPGLTEEKRERYIDAISETTDRAAQLTRQLLAFARRQPLQRELFDVTRRIHGLEQIIATSLGSPITIDIAVPESLGNVEADPNQFDTALLNIIINARDAMPMGGQLTISAGRSAGLPQALAETGGGGPFALVSIEDTGTGMTPETVSRIFEPFFTTKEVNKGTGLGLSQVYGFVKQSGGEIEVESELGTGTKFTLYLPLADEARQQEVKRQRPNSSPRTMETWNVLLVEDNERVGEFALGLLAEIGQRATWVRDGKEALEVLEDDRNAFDIVFSDVVMPGMSGVELAQNIRNRWPDLPVVLTSGYSHILAEEGSHGFELLQKPYSLQSLIDFLGRRRASNEIQRE